MSKKQRRMLVRIILAAVLTAVVTVLPTEGALRLALYLVPYFVIGYDILLKALHGICNRQVLDENFLMAIATVGAFVIAYTQSGEYTEAVAVMLFYQVGELFQSYAVGKSRRSISALMDIRPDHANLERDGTVSTVSPEEVDIGSIIVIKPGERVPIDGIVVSGESALNTSALTGESLPRDVSEGSEVISGCVNMTGLLRVRTTKAYGESAVARILEAAENSAARKSKSEAYISRFARVYTPIVCASALLLAVLVPLFRQLVLGWDAMWNVWIYRALTFLVISCPCALVISIPLSFFAGIGGASRAGILVKGSDYLEILAKVDKIVFDKTGTLTRGVLEVKEIHSTGCDRMLEYAAHAEASSTHPIAKSLVRAYGEAPDISRVSDVRERGGSGVVAKVDGKEIAVGNARLMKQLGVEFEDSSRAGAVVHTAIDGKYAGYILIADTVKDSSAEAISKLRSCGVTRTVMLTGDVESVAAEVASEVGIDKYYSNLLPTDKAALIERLMAEKRGKGKLAFVGDGINDAPALASADIGVSMGAVGSDAAIEAADVVLMDDDPIKLARAIEISRKCIRIVRQNVFLALGIKLCCLVLGAVGIANMWLAVFADVGVMVIAVLNAIRALSVKKR
ncbi:MAG: heavy metal translocating P-type ATPase [Oscillospiraceae bacterium]